MKTVLKFILLFMSVLFISCGEADTAIYDGQGGQTFLSFSSGVYSLPVVIDDTGSVEVVLNSSTKSDVDRVYSVKLVTEETTADPLTYTLPATVTIPAGSYQGILTIEGEDNDLVEVEPKNIVIILDQLSEDVIMDSNKAVIQIGQVCPITEGAFTGSYLIEQITPDNPADGVPVFPTGIVNITASSETARSFSAVFLGDLGIGQPASVVPFNLACGNTIVSRPTISTFLICGSGQPTILLGPGALPGEYDANDDSEFTLTMSEYLNNTGAGCGASLYQVTFKFTKQ